MHLFLGMVEELVRIREKQKRRKKMVIEILAIIILIAIVADILIHVVGRNNAHGNSSHSMQQGRRNGGRMPAGSPSEVLRPAAARQETGPMVYFANDRHGRTDREYQFNYKRVGNSWRAYILRIPNLEGRGSGAPHQLHDGDGMYICWDKPVNNLKDMQNISRAWADNVQDYLVTGRWFS